VLPPCIAASPVATTQVTSMLVTTKPVTIATVAITIYCYEGIFLATILECYRGVCNSIKLAAVEAST
jgi:hypothetical protein